MKAEYKDLVEQLNRKLAVEYGYFSLEVPNYRIVYSDDQFEWRNAAVNKFDVHGNRIGETIGIQHLPKYRQWLPHMWVLERCCDAISELKNNELVTPYSYEPLFPFRNKFNEPLPPDWEICWLVIANINAHMGRPIKIYKDETISKEAYALKISKLQEELFGNETSVSEALSYREGVAINNDSMRIKQ